MNDTTDKTLNSASEEVSPERAKKIATKKVKIAQMEKELFVESSGNVFKDMGCENPEEKADKAMYFRGIDLKVKFLKGEYRFTDAGIQFGLKLKDSEYVDLFMPKFSTFSLQELKLINQCLEDDIKQLNAGIKPEIKSE